jgi:1-acyl-sn-glycerol-3-phosphate acyltransferase
LIYLDIKRERKPRALKKKILEKTLYGVSVPLIKTYTGTMLSMDVEQKTPFGKGAKIIAPNHPSMVDPFIMASILGQQSYILITDVMFHVPVMGAYLRRLGHIPVIPGRGQEAMDTALEHLSAGHTIMIFPEGANSPKNGGYMKEHTGVARLAIASGAPVYPVGIYLQNDRLKTLESIVSGKTELSNWYLRGPYAITTGNPMYLSGDVEDHEHVKNTAHQIMLMIMRLAAESQHRWYHNNPPVSGAFEIS